MTVALVLWVVSALGMALCFERLYEGKQRVLKPDTRTFEDDLKPMLVETDEATRGIYLVCLSVSMISFIITSTVVATLYATTY